MSPAERLDGTAIRTALAGQPLGHTVLVLEEIGSTNDIVRELAASHEDGLVVFAEYQTAGRGQHGRRWESAKAGGLWFSILLRPILPAHDLHRITTWAAESVARTIQQLLALPAQIKPPNDVVLEKRKIAGVLFEISKGQAGALGIGVNVNQQLQDFPLDLQARAASLAMFCDQPVARQDLAIALLRTLQATCCASFIRSAQSR